MNRIPIISPKRTYRFRLLAKFKKNKKGQLAEIVHQDVEISDPSGNGMDGPVFEAFMGRAAAEFMMRHVEVVFEEIK